MKFKKIREALQAKSHAKYEKSIKAYKLTKTYIFLLRHKYFTKLSSTQQAKQRLKLTCLMAAMPKESKTKLSRRCALSNKNKIFAKEFPLGRHKILELLKAGVLPGYKKAVW